MANDGDVVWHTGSCHCKAIQFRVRGGRDLLVQECNCSLCDMVGYLHWIVPGSALEIVQGEECITRYQFNTRTAVHMFCKVCGVKPFYVPRSNPDGYSINFRCLDKSNVRASTIEPFDGQNWEQSGASLAHLSAE